VALGFCLALCCAACGEPASSELVLWEDEPVEPPEAARLAEQPWLLDVSTWSAPGCGDGQPIDPGQMGDFAVGNGRVFSLIGYACPLNTLHSMIGPDYQRDDRFFEDTYTRLLRDGARLVVRDGRVFGVRRVPVVITRERMDEADMLTLTFAPVTGAQDDPVERAVIREIIIVNRTASMLSGLEVETTIGQAEAGERQRTVIALEPPDVADVRHIPLELGPGEERRVVIAYVTSPGGDGEEETIAALRGADVPDLLDATRDAWRAFFEQAATLESPDPRVDDLYHGLLLTVRSQQSVLGGVSPMSEYTRVWTRDLAGPVRFYLRTGLFEQARAALAYYHTAAAEAGDIRNSFDANVEPDEPVEEPDWESLDPFEGREAAEAPSFLPLMARWYALASGDRSLVGDWFPFFRRALDGQALDEDDLLTFSGDETYRTAMAIAFGLALDHEFEVCCLSANSSFLFVAGSEALADEAEALGLESDAADLRARADRVREAAERTYWRTDGAYAPYLDRADPGTLPPPYEDVSMQPIWAGYFAPGDERALENLATVIERIARPDGLLVSPLDPEHDNAFGLGIHEGVYTGMNPGYGLFNLAVTDHPLAEQAFNTLRRVLSPSGNIGEYQVYDDHSALQVLYDPTGILGDYTARYRPWEGGIVGDALVLFLTGLVPDAPGGAVTLAPRLPNGWPAMTWRRLRVGDVRFDLRVEERGGLRTFAVEPTSDGSLTVRLEVPLPACEVREVRVDGVPLAPDAIERWSPFGLTRVRLPAREVSRSEPFQVEVEWSPR
jgi:hypothetical protein